MKKRGKKLGDLINKKFLKFDREMKKKTDYLSLYIFAW